MWYLYLDESGDLGFDFVNKKPSNFFTVTILLVKGVANNRALINAVKKTLRRKLNPKRKRRRIVSELKGNSTSMEVKKYFYKQVAGIPLELFCLTMDKRQAFHKLAENKHRVYNYITRLVLDRIEIDVTLTRMEVIVDKTKNIAQAREFNSYVINQLEGKLDPQIPLDIYHKNSVEEHGLQAVDMFSSGVFRKYERDDFEWYNAFRDRIHFDRVFPENKK